MINTNCDRCKADIMQSGYAIFDLDGERIIAPDTQDGRMLASAVLGGDRADAEAAQATGLLPDPLNNEQARHMKQHGWACICDLGGEAYEWTCGDCGYENERLVDTCCGCDSKAPEVQS